MKTTLRLLCLVLAFAANRAVAQSMDDFFRSKGVKDLCEAAHPNNDYQEGKYYIGPDHVSISIVSVDFMGTAIYTDMQLIKGKGDLPFTELILVRDTDPFKTFDAFKLHVQMVMLTYKGLVGAELFNRTVSALQILSNKRVADWDGATWALLAVNFDYYSYMLSGN